MCRGNKGPGPWYNLGHITKMAANPIYCGNTSKVFSGTKRPFTFPLGMLHWGLQPIIACSNVDRSSLVG